MDIGDWHVIILHFPIVLFWTAFVYDLLGWVMKFKVYPAGHWIVIIATLIAIPTVLTGIEYAEAHPPNPDITIHHNWALATLSYALLHASLRLYIIVAKKSFKSLLFVCLSFINVLLVSITAEYGGAAAFGKAIFITPHEESKEH